MDLVAVDAAGQTDVLERYSFPVEEEPVILHFDLETEGAAPRTKVGPAYIDYRHGTSLEYFVGSSYKIAPLQIRLGGTEVSEGSVADITYRLNQSDTTELFVNSDTGVVFGEFTAASPKGEPFLVELVAIDAAGRTAVVETYAFNVRERVVFRTRPDIAQPRAQVGDDFDDYGSIKFYVGSSYKIAPMQIDPSPNATMVSAGKISDITYRLDQSNSTDFFVNSNTGVVFGKFTAASAAGMFSMRLFAVDAGGQAVLFERYLFPVLRCRTGRNEVWLGGRCQPCSPGSSPLEAVDGDPTQCALDGLAGCPDDNATRTAHAGNRCVCAAAGGPLASCTCKPLDVLASKVHVRCTRVRTLPDALPVQTTQLRLAGLVEGVDTVALMQSSAALNTTGQADAQPIVVILDTASAIVDNPARAAAEEAAASTGGAEEDRPTQPSSSVDDEALCLGSADTSTPSRVHAVVCSEEAGCSETESGAAGDGNYTDRVCARGSFAAPDGTGCLECDRGGFFLEETGKMGWFSHCACNKCNNGTFSNAFGASDPVQDCLVCPSGTNTSVEAGFRACPCLSNSSRTDRFGECTSCLGQKGIECAGDHRRTAPGYHWTFPTAAKLEEYTAFVLNLGKSYNYDRGITRFNGTLPPAYKCPNKEACLGGIEAECVTGTTGPLCAVCDTGHFTLNGQCEGAHALSCSG